MIEISNILEVEKYLDGIKVAIFDLDDTLYSEKEYVLSGYQAIAEKFPEVSDMAVKLWDTFEKGGKAIDEVLMSENIFTVENKDECLNIYRFHKPKIKLYDGVMEMLFRIRKKGIKTAIITDGRPEGQHAKIDSLKLNNLFDRIIITDELGGIEFRKPNTKAFEIIKNYFGVKYSQIFYVGDNIHKDFVAPSKFGMKMIYFKNINGLYVG